MQEKQNKTALIWFNNDLRVHDNAILNTAISENTIVIAVYFFDPRHYELSSFGYKKTEKYRAKFLIETIHDLKTNLKALNIELLVFNEKPEYHINTLILNYGISKVYTQTEWNSEEKQVLKAVKNGLPKQIKLFHDYDQFLYHPNDIDLSFPEVPKVFTNFRKYVEKYATIRSSISNPPIDKTFQIKNKTRIPNLNDLGFEEFKTSANSAFPFEGGEKNAINRLNYYFFESKKLGVYKKTRNGLIGQDFSSKFSPWLANGSLSARTIYWKVKQFEKNNFKNESTYWLIFELIWRDFFKYISLKHNNQIFKIEGILNSKYNWNQDKHTINAWVNGATHSAFVNANLTELNKTGWMSNRGRQNVASYFSKTLKLDWRIGAAYFESLLIDYDVDSNYGNWMYVSGVGNDPRNRTFNVSLQAQRYDPNRKFQNLWL